MHKPVFAALNTLRASRLTVLLARMFGRKSTVTDSGCTVTIYEWRGKMYLTDCKQDA